MSILTWSLRAVFDLASTVVAPKINQHLARRRHSSDDIPLLPNVICFWHLAEPVSVSLQCNLLDAPYPICTPLRNTGEIDQMPHWSLRACRSETVTPPALASTGSIAKGGGAGCIPGGAVDEFALDADATPGGCARGEADYRQTQLLDNP